MQKTITKEILFENIKEILDKKYWLQKAKNGENEYYKTEIYTDYNDYLEDRTIKEIFKQDNPREYFYEKMDEWYRDTEWQYQDDLSQEIKDGLEEIYEDTDLSEMYEYIEDYVRENVCFVYPYDHFLNQDVYVDIIVDTGDGNYDFTCNELFGCNYREAGYDKNSSLVWLMRNQGYKVPEIKKFINNKEYGDSKFLKSIYNECINTTTCMNALTFFVKMTIGECMDFNERMNELNKADVGNMQYYPKTRKYKDYIILKNGTPCGLYDAWNGAGSVLEIELEQDVKLPIKYIDSALPDGCRGYSIGEIYGMCLSFWKGNTIGNILTK